MSAINNIFSFFTLERLKQMITFLLYLTLLTPTIVAGSFLFPYISGRTIYFRLLIEAAFILFLFIFVRKKIKFSGQKNYFFYIFGAFAISNIISSFFSYSLSIAWFSDIERMWGIFTLMHLFLFYVLLRIFFGGREWKIFLNISLAVSLYAAFYGLAQHYPEVIKLKVFQAGADRIISTLGNSAYVAIYMLFNVFFALFLLMKTNRVWLKYLYAGIAAVDFFAFNLAGIRGTILGFVFSLVCVSLLYILLSESKKCKLAVALILLVFSSVLFFAFLNPKNTWVKQAPLLQKIASISLTGGTIETRMIGWRAAWRGFLEQPIFGVGMDNYNTVFNKYFDANYYLYAPSEPYFDRSHNAWLDLLVMNGGVGFMIFLGLPIFLFHYLIKGYRQDKIKLDEFLLFLALSITYFTHLIFVFDDLNSCFYFVALFAFVEYRHHKDELILINDEQSEVLPVIKLAAGIAIVVIATAAYNFNIKTAFACQKVITALNYSQDLEKSAALFKQALDYNIIPSRNILMAYINYLTQIGGNFRAIANDQPKAEIIKQSFMEANEALDKEIKKDSYNALLYDRKAVINNFFYLIFGNPMYIRASLDASQKAMELSHEHLQYYYTLADTYLISGQPDSAIDAVRKSLAINNRYNFGYYYLARVYLAADQLDQSLSIAQSFKARGYAPPDNSFFLSLANKFESQGKLLSAIKTAELALAANEKDTQALAKLIRLNLKNGEYGQAVEAAKKLGETDASLVKDVNYVIQQIAAGKVKELLAEMEGGK